MSFFRKLFGLGNGEAAQNEAQSSITYEGYEIIATPYQERGKYQLCGIIAKEIDGERKEHRFIRADQFTSVEDAVEMTFFKGRQIIDQTGMRLFRADD
jgi:hypothetical protein